MSSKPETVDQYLDALDPAVREQLDRLREAIHEAVPGAAEKLRYGMPAIAVAEGEWLHLGAWRRHVGVYPVPRLPEELEARVAPYRTTTSTVRFSLSQRIPDDLVREIAEAMSRGRQ